MSRPNKLHIQPNVDIVSTNDHISKDSIGVPEGVAAVHTTDQGQGEVDGVLRMSYKTTLVGGFGIGPGHLESADEEEERKLDAIQEEVRIGTDQHVEEDGHDDAQESHHGRSVGSVSHLCVGRELKWYVVKSFCRGTQKDGRSGQSSFPVEVWLRADHISSSRAR